MLVVVPYPQVIIFVIPVPNYARLIGEETTILS
jgi:hypothetical protein